MCKKEEMKREILNKSYSYLIPLLNQHIKISKEWFILLKNVYTRFRDESKVIVLVYEKYESEDFENYLNKLKQSNLFKYSLEEEEMIILIFNFPEEYLEEYEYYNCGKFSKFNNDSKLKILNYLLDVHNARITNKVKNVLYKNSKLRQQLEKKLNMDIDKDAELSSIPNPFNETLIL